MKFRWFWNMELINSPVEAIVVAVAVLALVLVVVGLHVVRKPRRRIRTTLICALLGAAVFSGIIAWMQAADAFDGPLPDGTAPWVPACGAAIGVGLLGLFGRPWWNPIVAVILILASALGLGLHVNRLYGITNTPAMIFGFDTLAAAELPHLLDDKAGDEVTIANWKPPADMPHAGTVGSLIGKDAIPASKPYTTRPGSVYLPPAALVKNPPRLPVIVATMGQPGTPDPHLMMRGLDAYVSHHQGLGPIVVVVDQLAGNPAQDPTCVDSAKYGAVSTYVNVDTVKYIESHFNVLKDRKNWAIAGYSNGGSCAWQWGTEFPEVWGAMLDVSGNEYPGSAHPDKVVAALWNGDKAAYQAWLPPAQIAKHKGAYKGHLASFTWGDDDNRFGPGARANVKRAKAAGFETKTHPIVGGGHVGNAVRAGFSAAIADFGTFTGMNAHATAQPWGTPQ